MTDRGWARRFHYSTWVIVGVALACGLVCGGAPVLFGDHRKIESVPELLADARGLRDSGDYAAGVIKLNTVLTEDPRNIEARLAAAQIDLDLHEDHAALGIVLRAREKGATDLEIGGLLAEAELATRRYDDVIKTTELLPSDIPQEMRASLLAYRAQALGALGDAEAAREAIDSSLAADPHSVDARIAAARQAIADGDLQAAREQVALAGKIRSVPLERALDQVRGDIEYSAQDHGKAAQIYRELLREQPWNQLARADLAASLLAENKLTEAAASLDSVLKDPDLDGIPKDPLLSHIRAVVAYRQKDYQLAKSYEEEVVARASFFEPAQLIAGASDYAVHSYEESYYYMSSYVAAVPHNLLARELLAEIDLRLNHPADAAKILAPVKDAAAGNADLLTLIGEAAVQSGDLADAGRYLRLAAERRPDDAKLRLTLGEAEMAAGNSKAGIGDLELAAKAQPETLGPLVSLFVAYLKVRDYDNALAMANQVEAAQPKATIGYLLLSAVYLAKGESEQGKTALMKARELHPGDMDANGNLAKLMLAEGKPDEAVQYYDEILKSHPASVKTYIALAELYIKTGKLAKAEATLARGESANPGNLIIDSVWAHLQLAGGKAQSAMNLAKAALKKSPREPALLDVLGRAQLDLGQREAAVSTFRDLVNLRPQAAWAHTDLATAYLSLYTPATPQWDAVNEATEAVKLLPGHKEANLVLAQALLVHGRYAEARGAVNTLKRMDDHDLAVIELDGMVSRAEGHLADAAAAFAGAIAAKDTSLDRERLADLQIELGLRDDAIKTLADGVAVHGDDLDLRRRLADSYVTADRFHEAEAEYEEIVTRDPKNAIAQNDLAYVLLHLGRLRDALDHAQRAVALAPGSADALDTFGATLLANGDPSTAVPELDRAWRASQQRADVGVHLAQALAGAGRKAEALALLRGLLESKEPFKQRTVAQQLLQQLGG
jgi:putative PEP-CTERM system TPR-repeat lipoprotein